MTRHHLLHSPGARRRLGGILLVLAVLVAAVPSSRGEDAKIGKEELKQLKAATVMLLVKLPNGRTIQGTGFFVLQDGLIVTNAHVLGMLDPTSRRPMKVEVIVHSGEKESQTLVAKVVGVDRGSDLGLVKVVGKGLPKPMKIGSAKDVTETDQVFIFGFPLADRIGKNITVSKANVSSLRKTGTFLRQIQVDGGMHPGNSGGPVTNAKGEVVGVAVSGVRNSSIRFAIPAELLNIFLNGRITGFIQDQDYKEDGKVMLPVVVEMIDPLGKVRKVQVDCWAANPGPGRGASEKEPAALPGDGPKETFVLKYDPKTGLATGDVALPKLTKPGQVYFVRPVYTNGEGVTKWVSCSPRKPGMSVERKEIDLKFKPAGDARYVASLFSDGSFRMRDDDDTDLSLALAMKTIMVETNSNDVEDGVQQSVNFPQFAMAIKVNNKPVAGQDRFRKVAGDAKRMVATVELDKEGALTRASTDLNAVPRDSREMLSDLSDEILQALEVLAVPLPNQKIKPLHTWNATRSVTIGALDYAVPALANMQFKYIGTSERNGRKVAVIQLTATLKGTRGGGGNIGGTFRGAAQVDLETGMTLRNAGTFRVDMDLTAGRRTLKAVGSLYVEVNRGPAVLKKKD